MKKTTSGFTIVELLIVIVVIAILATISIVAYNGIQSRAKNQQTVTAVRAYYSALQIYVLDNGALPSGQGCIGVQSFYTSNPCYIGSGTYAYNATINDALSEYMSSVPTLPSGRISNTGGTLSASGIYYRAVGTGDTYIGFPILSSATCPDIAGATYGTNTAFGSDIYCRINLPGA